MTSIIQRGIDISFPSEILQTIAFSILRNSEFHEKEEVKSLKWLALRREMERRMKENGIYSNLIFSLIFKEPVNLENFRKRFRIYGFFRRLRVRIQRKITGDPEKIFQTLRTDPIVMKAVLEQNLKAEEGVRGAIRITIRRKSLIIEEKFGNAEIFYEKDYDMYWPRVFTRIALSKFIWLVTIALDGEKIEHSNSMKAILTPMVDSIDPIIPREGWKEAMKNGTRKIYTRNNNVVADGRYQIEQFRIETDFKPHYLPIYWGYLEE